MSFFSAGLILSHWGFYLIGFLLWGLIVVSGVLFIWALWKESWKAFLISGISFLIPSVVLSTQHGWFSLFLILPLTAFILSFFTKKRFSM